MKKNKLTLRRHDLLKSKLIREVIGIRTDSLWSMLSRKYIPPPNQEGATGRYDNNGMIIVPGGFVPQDSERNKIEVTPFSTTPPNRDEFLDEVRKGMSDNVIALYHQGLARAINLDNAHYVNLALNILQTTKDARKHRKRIDRGFEDKTTEDVTRSYLPPSVPRHFVLGSRSILTSSIGVCLSYPSVYKDLAAIDLRLDKSQKNGLMEKLKQSRQPIKSDEGELLATPYEVIMHDSRYTKPSMTGLTRIIGDGEFGEFVTFTLEEITDKMINSMGKTEMSNDEIFATYNGKSYAGILRHYPPVDVPGKRSGPIRTHVVNTKSDLGIDVTEIEESARDYYEIPRNNLY